MAEYIVKVGEEEFAKSTVMEELVRCKDCKKAAWNTAKSDGCRHCYCIEHGEAGYTENDYCSRGKRKDGE